MEDTNNNRLAYLNINQEAIKRMAGNSFLVKGWSVTLVSAMLAISVTSKRPEIAFLSVGPGILFAGWDAYWLRQERLFRAIHEQIRLSPEGTMGEQMFSMNTKLYSDKVPGLLKTLVSLPLIGLYGGLIAVSLAFALIGNWPWV
ncbi:MAG: hypothetical protein O3A33_13020 [Chloroflexi bacterium]|nr:hypothetical protein [Chloroflexota bacterium]